MSLNRPKKSPGKRASSPGGGILNNKKKRPATLTSADSTCGQPRQFPGRVEVPELHSSWGHSLSHQPVTNATPTAPTDSETIVSVASSNPGSPAPSESNTETKVQYVFKDPNFVHSTKAGKGKTIRIWKNLKQICASERGLPWNDNDVTYSSVDAPPNFCPAKKYSDITGLPAKYTDPQTKIRYATTEEFQRIRMLPSDLVTGYLTLRKASIAVP